MEIVHFFSSDVSLKQSIMGASLVVKEYSEVQAEEQRVTAVTASRAEETAEGNQVVEVPVAKSRPGQQAIQQQTVGQASQQAQPTSSPAALPAGATRQGGTTRMPKADVQPRQEKVAVT